jgi:excisionase family DNA binding protein
MKLSREKVAVNVAARIVGKSEATVRRWVRQGKISFERPSPHKTLIPRTDLEAIREED